MKAEHLIYVEPQNKKSVFNIIALHFNCLDFSKKT